MTNSEDDPEFWILAHTPPDVWDRILPPKTTDNCAKEPS